MQGEWYLQPQHSGEGEDKELKVIIDHILIQGQPWAVGETPTLSSLGFILAYVCSIPSELTLQGAADSSSAQEECGSFHILHSKVIYSC